MVPILTRTLPRHMQIRCMYIFILISPTCQLFQPQDITEFQTQISRNFSDGFHKLAKDLLQTDELENVFTSHYASVPLDKSHMDSMVSSLVDGVQGRFDLALSAIKDVKDKLLVYMTSPQSPRSGPPRPVQECCQMYAPGSLANSHKLRLMVKADQPCFSRDLMTSSQGFDMWADDALDAMKTNFETDPSILWQEVATTGGLHVQFPTKDRSCDSRGNSNAKILRQWYRDKVTQPPLNLVIVLDASDDMNNMAQTPKLMSQWDIIKKAAIDIIETLLPGDRISVVSTGHLLQTPKFCNSSLVVATQRNLEGIHTFLQSLSASGSPQYPEAFKQAFDLLIGQQTLDKSHLQGETERTNVILFLTNSETNVLYPDALFTAVADGQSQLTSKSQIQVYTLLQGGPTSPMSLHTFLQLADQNNQVTSANDGTANVTAAPWPGFNQPVGPAGYMDTIPDNMGLFLSDKVINFAGKLSLSGSSGPSVDVILHPVELGTEGTILHSVLPLVANNGNNYGLLTANLSVEYLLADVIGFRHQLHSYAFVVEKSTGHVLTHPKIASQSKAKVENVAMPTLEDLEPSLTTVQMSEIMQSDDAVNYFQAQITPGRELYRNGNVNTPSPEDVTVGHQLVKGTNFIVVLVLFDSERVRLQTSQQAPGPSSSAVYHRFDLLPPSSPPCVTSGTRAMEQKLGIMFSPDLYQDPQAYKYQVMSPSDVTELDTFVKHQVIGPKINSILNLGPAGYRHNNTLIDLQVLTSDVLTQLWDNTETTAQERYVGTLSGVLMTHPALALPNTVDYRNYQWFSQSLSSPGQVTLSLSKFAASSWKVIISQAFGQRQPSVTGATVNRHVLEMLIYNQVPLCATSDYSCQLMDASGYLVDVTAPASPTQADRPHITSVYPWLANVLIKSSNMQTTWCSDVISGENRRKYVITGTSSITNSPSATEDCRKFVLQQVKDSNFFLLVLADRSVSNCLSENQSPMEDCSLPPSVPPLPGQPLPPSTLLPACSTCSPCVYQANPSPPCQKCQPPCYCDTTLESCSGHLVRPSGGAFLVSCYEEPGEPPSDAVRPNPPAPTTPACPKLCSEFATQADCENRLDCLWETSKPHPTCIHIVHTTTTSTTTTTTPTTATTATTMPTVTLTPATSVKPTAATVISSSSSPLITTSASPSPLAPSSFVETTTHLTTSEQLPLSHKDEGDGDDDLTAAIAGGTVAGLILLVIAAIIVYHVAIADWLKNRKRVSHTETSETDLLGRQGYQGAPIDAWPAQGNVMYNGASPPGLPPAGVQDVSISVPPARTGM